MSGPSMKKSKVETVVEQWCHLPDDILAIILSHLSGKDYLCFLSVCRSWRSAPPRPRTIPNNPYFSEATSRYPYLFHFSGNSSQCKFYDPFCNGSYVAHRIPDELIDSRIHFSNYGWLLMSLGVQLFFFHPFTNQRIDIPRISKSPLLVYGKFCFSSPPTSPDCMVFAIADRVDISLIRRGEILWSSSICLSFNVSFYSSHCNPVFYKGAFYCLSLDGKLGVFYPNKMLSHRWKLIHKLKYPCESIQENFLVESNGELISICMGRIGEHVKVFRLINFDCKMISWEEVHSLGDHMIFASHSGCISMQTDTMGNTLYFAKFDSGGNGLFYSLASRKFHSLGLALARKDLYDTKRILHCAWITPVVSEIYVEDELKWLQHPKKFVSSSERVKVETAHRAHPSFVLPNDEDSNNQLFFNLFDSYHNVQGRLEIGEMRSVTYAFGWLFQVNWDFSNCLLHNPRTMEKIHLPRLPGRFDFCAISSSPNDTNCTVLLTQYIRYKGINFFYCKPGESEWTMTIKKPGELISAYEGLEIEERYVDRISNVVGYRGKIYGLSSKLKLVEIDFDPVFEVNFVRTDVHNDQVWLPWDYSLGTLKNYKTYMVESCGELYVIRVNFHGHDENPSNIDKVEVFKLDYAKKVWETVGSLSENVALFCYGDGYGVSCSSMEEMPKRKGNSIYFIGTALDYENIYTFDFEDGSISIYRDG